jgi:hypothetical protein
MLDGFEQVLIQPFMANSPVLTLDIGILLRFPWLDIQQPDTLLLGPCLQLITDVFRAIIATNRQWLASPFDDLFQRTDHA